MSYILDALQKSSEASSSDAFENQPRAEKVGLPLLWKLAIGAVLATNLVFLYLWQADRKTPESGEVLMRQQDSGADNQAQRRQPAYSQGTNPTRAVSGSTKKTLPGIASPRDWPPPPAAPKNTGSAGTARTFKPTGAPITIADAPIQREQFSPPAPSKPTPQRKPSVTDRSIQAQQTAAKGRNRQVYQLSELSENARQSLYVLSFSFHIYAEDADLRAVVVNGRRLTEGSTIESDGDQNFKLVEILENGVVVKFDHEGQTQSVQIPVMEDWKDA